MSVKIQRNCNRQLYLHGKNPAGRLPQCMLHSHLQALEVVVLDNESQDRPLEVPLALTEGAMSRDQTGELRRRVP